MKKWIVGILLIAVFIFSVIAGFIVKSYVNFSKKDEKGEQAVLAEEEKKSVVDVSSREETVSPNAEVVLTQKYGRCGHVISVREIVPREIINLDREGVQNYFNEWNIDDFSANEIHLSKNTDGICGEHYVLRESEGYISISCKNDVGEYIFKGLTDIPVQYLPEEDLARLENGIEIVGRDSLNKFLEDFE